MNFMQRSWLYIIRKKGKTAVMFILLFVMATAIMSSIVIKKAAYRSIQQTRESIGAYFTLQLDYSNHNPYIKQKEEQTDDGTTLLFENEGPPLDEQILAKLNLVHGLRSINGSRSFGIASNGLMHIEQGNSDQSIHISNKENDASDTMAYLQLHVDAFSQLNSWFEDGRLRLLEGRHITKEDSYKVLVHKDFATKNKLKIGDVIPLQTSSNMSGEETAGSRVEVEIIGIFEHTKETRKLVPSPYFMGENNLFTDITTGKQLLGIDTFTFDIVKCTIKDPKQMPAIIEEVQQLDIDWKQFALDTNDAQYKQIAGSITRLDDIVTTILYAIFIVSCIILTLILSLWIKSRMYETGILLSLGLTKRNILLQYSTELLMIAVAAFTISIFSTHVIAQSISDALIASMQTQQQTQEESGMISSSQTLDNEGGNAAAEEITSLQIHIQTQEILLVYGIGTGLILLSVCISSIPVLRLKPKEILSKMS